MTNKLALLFYAVALSSVIIYFSNRLTQRGVLR